MASKNLKKVLRGTITRLTLETHPVNGHKALKYIEAKGKARKHNAKYREYYLDFRNKGYDKKEAKKLVKARFKAEASAQQGSEGQDQILT